MVALPSVTNQSIRKCFGKIWGCNIQTYRSLFYPKCSITCQWTARSQVFYIVNLEMYSISLKKSSYPPLQLLLKWSLRLWFVFQPEWKCWPVNMHSVQQHKSLIWNRSDIYVFKFIRHDLQSNGNSVLLWRPWISLSAISNGEDRADMENSLHHTTQNQTQSSWPNQSTRWGIYECECCEYGNLDHIHTGQYTASYSQTTTNLYTVGMTNEPQR